MAMARIEQRTKTDCMVPCLAMLLDLSYETVAGWFDHSHRSPNSLADAVLTLVKHGYTIQFFDGQSIGLNGGSRRLIGSVENLSRPLANGESFQVGHIFVASEDDCVIDPTPGMREGFNVDALSDRMLTMGGRIEWVALIKSAVA